MKAIDPKILGKRLKFFRERAHISQFELENKMSAASGMISRIENGKVNPSKETVLTISEVLKMNSREVSYLIGPLSRPATNDEVNEAIEEIETYFSKKNVFAYLLDDRFRFLYVSEGFIRLFSHYMPNVDYFLEKNLNHPLSKLILSKKTGIANFLSGEFFDELLDFQLGRIYNEMGFMKDDQYYIETIEQIEKHPKAKIAWNNINNHTVNINTAESKTIPFIFNGFKITLQYSREPLSNNPRFETVEYFPTNKLLRFVSNLL